LRANRKTAKFASCLKELLPLCFFALHKKIFLARVLGCKKLQFCKVYIIYTTFSYLVDKVVDDVNKFHTFRTKKNQFPVSSEVGCTRKKSIKILLRQAVRLKGRQLGDLFAEMYTCRVTR
jgi:hypothetical protein